MDIVKPKPELIEKEKEEAKARLREEESNAAQREQWKKSSFYEYVMTVIDEEIDKADSIDNLPSNAPKDEIGEFAIIAKAVKLRLLEIRKRLS